MTQAECYEPYAHPEHDWTEEDDRTFHCPGIVSVDWRNYGAMPREQLIERLRRAEDVCVYAGWTANTGGARGDAATELWMRWAGTEGVDPRVASNVELAAAEDSLAGARRVTRTAIQSRR